MRLRMPVHRLGVKPFLLVLAMMLLTLGASHLTTLRSDARLIENLKGQTESLSKALQISLQKLTSSQGTTEDTLLRDYVDRLSSRGVREISILSPAKEVVATARSGAPGKRPARSPARRDRGGFVITGTLGEPEEPGEEVEPASRTVQELEIPIVVNDEKKGYLRLRLVLEDIEELLREAQNRRLVATVIIFLLGLAGLVGLSYRTIRDLNRIGLAAREVARGDLSVQLETRRRDELGEVIRTVNQMVEKLREQRSLERRLRRAERASSLGALASAVAHEIRNPLNLIGLSVDYLGRDFRPVDGEEEFRRVVGSVREELKRLNQMVQDFLDYGRPSRLAFQECSFEEIVDEVLECTAAQARRQGVAVMKRVAAPLPVVRADRDALRRCLLNVVVNGIQAMPRGGTLTVEADAERQPPTGAAVRIGVRDTGEGIPVENQEKIFEPYFSTREGGVGLGLPIARKILEEHGGRITAEGAPGGGTAFLLRVPVDGPPAEEDASGRGVPAGGGELAA